MSRRILVALDETEASQRASEFVDRYLANEETDVLTLTVAGDPSDVIREQAESHDVDLVVVGTTEKGWWTRLVEGSVSDDLVRHAERPVLVVR